MSKNYAQFDSVNVKLEDNTRSVLDKINAANVYGQLLQKLIAGIVQYKMYLKEFSVARDGEVLRRFSLTGKLYSLYTEVETIKSVDELDLLIMCLLTQQVNKSDTEYYKKVVLAHHNEDKVVVKPKQVRTKTKHSTESDNDELVVS